MSFSSSRLLKTVVFIQALVIVGLGAALLLAGHGSGQSTVTLSPPTTVITSTPAQAQQIPTTRKNSSSSVTTTPAQTKSQLFQIQS